MFKVLANAWKVQEIRSKLLFVFFVLLVYRIGSTVPLPGVDLYVLDMIRAGGHATGADTFFMMMMGGGFGSIMAMGIAPYITASIIMQLLTVAIPKLEQIKKEGEQGRKTINKITRYLAVGLAVLQAAATVYSYVYNPLFHGAGELAGMSLFAFPHLLVYIGATVAMVTGTIFIMWLAELLTERGIGNGASFLIFANILSSLPMGIQALALYMGVGAADPNLMLNVSRGLALLIAFAGIILFTVLVHEGERRIPVQYSNKMAGRSINPYIPIKVNIAGVMSIIFAMSLLGFPAQLNVFFQNDTMEAVANFLDLNNWGGAILYVVLIFMFTFFYTSFAVNTVEMAENMKKNGGFVPGIRPGKPTSEYVQNIVDRMSWIGAVCYSLIAITPIVLSRITGMNIGFGGTTLLIATGVALEFIKQLESQLLMRHYKGFLS